MYRKLIVAVGLLLLLLLIGFSFFFRQSELPSKPQSQGTSSAQQPSVRETTSLGGNSCCELVANSQLTDQGRVVVNFPAGLNLSHTMVYVYQPGAPMQVALSTGNGIFPLPPGHYDVGIYTIRLAGVPVRAGFDTRVKVGALRVSTDNATTYRVLSAADQHELAKGYGNSVFGLPVGQYVLRLKQDDKLVVIQDGGIADF